MAEENRKTIRVAVAAALKEVPVRDDPLFAAVRRAKVGSPVLVQTPTGEPAFWLAPLILHDKVCGLAEVDLSGQVSRLGILGGTPDDRQNWIAPSFFEEPPADLLAEIRDRFGESALATPVLSYDASPSRWAWQMKAGGRAGASVIFITPGGWYERRVDDTLGDRER